MSANKIIQLSPTELNTKQLENTELVLLDVREPWEYELAHISNSILIPLGQLPLKIERLDKHKEIVCLCHHGVRSYHAATYLVSASFESVYNLTGGIDAWSIDLDSTIPRY